MAWCFKFFSIYSKIAINIWAFLVLFESFSIRWLSQRGNDFILAEPMRERFHCWLSQGSTNDCVCSASIQILTVFTYTSGVMLSQREFHQSMTPDVYVKTVKIWMLAEHTQSFVERWLNQQWNRRTNFITVWVKADIPLNLRESQEIKQFFEGTQNFNNTLFGLIAIYNLKS